VGRRRRRKKAHLEHGVHFCDAAGVEAQRLVENCRTLPGPNERGHPEEGNAWHGDMAQREGRIGSARGVRVTHTAREGGQKAQAETHMKHVAHVRDAGGVKAQRLVESIRKLPSPKGAHDRGERVARKIPHIWKGESVAHAACMWPTAREWAEGAGGSAHRTCGLCL
jgi:hypothetical protein